MFSTRTDWDLRASPLFSLLQQTRASGKEIIDLTESNPTKCGFRYSASEFVNSASLERSTLYEPDPRGLRSARQAVADWYGRQDIKVDPDRIILASGTSEAYSFLFRLLCNLGDVVAVPQPSYPLFDYLARLNDILTHGYRLAYDGEWHIDLSSLEDTLAANAEALILVHPNNPTGSFIKEEEKDRILSMAGARKVPIIVDEVFGAFAFARDHRRADSFAGTGSTLTFTVNGLSKLCGLPQMKLAWIIVSGPEEECEQAVQRLEVIADTYLSVSTLAQQALPPLLQDHEAMTERILSRTRENHKSLKRECMTGSSASLIGCEGGWNAVLRLPEKRSDEEWVTEFLQKDGVFVHPGHLFDMGLKSCVIVSLLVPPDMFAQGIKLVLSTVEQ